MKGVEQPPQVNENLAERLRKHRAATLTVEEYLAGIRAGNRTVLSKAITLVESNLQAHRTLADDVIRECLQDQRSKIKDQRQGDRDEYHPDSIRIGITGVPGVGKSTFIEALGTWLTAQGHKLAVLAIDPSSSRSKGSILGDKTRMERLGSDPNAFIRPSPSAGSLGGVARKTRETILLCEAAGFDVIFVETVGVGQSETAVHSMVDFFLLLMLAGAGDELQGIKRGIIEMADAIVINKADGDNVAAAQRARAEYANALHLFPPSGSGWIPVADTCSAKTLDGVANVWKIICNYRETTAHSGYFAQKRREQDHKVLYDTIEEGIRQQFYSRKEISRALARFEKEIEAGRINPYQAAQEVLGTLEQ